MTTLVTTDFGHTQLISAERGRVKGLDSLASHLIELGRFKEALDVAYTLLISKSHAKALTRLVPHLPESERTQVLTEALNTAYDISYGGDRAKALTLLVPHLPETERPQVLAEALSTVRAISNENHRSWALADLAVHLPESSLTEALAVAHEIGGESDRALALSGIALRLAELGYIEKALTATREIEYQFAVDLIAQTSFWTKRDFPVVYSTFQKILPVLASHTREKLLNSLSTFAPVVAALSGPEAITELAQAIIDMGTIPGTQGRLHILHRAAVQQ